MTFDPFRDFDERGYLRNLYGSKDIIDWKQTDKTDYLTALTIELNTPGNGHLDLYLKPFIRNAIDRQRSTSALKSLKGLGSMTAHINKPKKGLG